MGIFLGCSLFFWAGVLLAIVGIVWIVAIARPGRGPVAGREAGDVAAARWPLPLAIIVLIFGVLLAGNTMWQGNCAAVAGTCPPAISTGSGYKCASPGGTCKVAGLFSGKCKDESSWVWNCVCQCR